MKTVFIPAESDVDIIPVLKKALEKLPDIVGIVTTAQHLHKLEEAREFLEKNKRKVFVGGQVLGCNVINAGKISGKADCILFIGSGRFHPTGLEGIKKIVTANPLENEVFEISEMEMQKTRTRKKATITKFLGADKIGVLITTKKGQAADIDRERLGKKYPDKQFFYFLTETLNISYLDNFPFIQCWVNTMCPRIAYGETKKAIVNLEDI